MVNMAVFWMNVGLILIALFIQNNIFVLFCWYQKISACLSGWLYHNAFYLFLHEFENENKNMCTMNEVVRSPHCPLSKTIDVIMI